MSRWVFAALVAAAGVLVWTIATWPVAPEPAVVEHADTATEQTAPPPPPTAAVATAPTEQPEPAEQLDPEPAAPAAPAAAPADPEAEADRVFTRENGPLADYKAQFEKEPRDSQAADVETVVRDAFNPKDGPAPVFRSVLCRETICKIETRFGHETLGAYVAAMTRIVHANFNSQLASERTSLVEAGEVSVTVYAKRPVGEEEER
jgi:hypothetical protein